MLRSLTCFARYLYFGWIQNEDRRLKTQKRRPPQNRLEITSKWFERDCGPKQKRETTRFAFINKFDQGLRFVHNPTKSTKRRPLQNCLEITSKWFERDSPPKQKQGTTRFKTRFAVINEFDQGVRFVYDSTKSTKRRPLGWTFTKSNTKMKQQCLYSSGILKSIII